MNGGGLADADRAGFERFLKDLDGFDTQGKRYHGVRTALKRARGSLTALQKGGALKEAPDAACPRARKDAALRAKSPKEAGEAPDGPRAIVNRSRAIMSGSRAIVNHSRAIVSRSHAIMRRSETILRRSDAQQLRPQGVDLVYAARRSARNPPY